MITERLYLTSLRCEICGKIMKKSYRLAGLIYKNFQSLLILAMIILSMLSLMLFILFKIRIILFKPSHNSVTF